MRSGDVPLVWPALAPVGRAPVTRVRATLDRPRARVYPAGMPPGDATQDLLRKQDWPKLSAQLTAYVFRRTHKRSYELAEELAQEAIAQAWSKTDGWDPSKGALIHYLAGIAMRLVLNEWRRKRTSFERVMDEEDERFANGMSDDADAPDDLLHRKRTARKFHDDLARSVGNAAASELLTLMTEGIVTPRDQAAASGRPIEEIRGARRVLFYHAEILSKKLATELDREDEAVT